MQIKLRLVTLQVTLSTKRQQMKITLHQERVAKIVNDYIVLERRFVFGESQESFGGISLPLCHTYYLKYSTILVWRDIQKLFNKIAKKHGWLGYTFLLLELRCKVVMVKQRSFDQLRANNCGERECVIHVLIHNSKG